MLLDLRISARRNDRLISRPQANRTLSTGRKRHRRKTNRPAIHLVEQIVDLISVMATVFGQYLRFNLLRFGIHRQVQLSPCPSFAYAMFTRLPFSFAEDFQAGAVDYHVNRAFACMTTANPQLGRPFGQRREVGNQNVKHQFTSERPNPSVCR